MLPLYEEQPPLWQTNEHLPRENGHTCPFTRPFSSCGGTGRGPEPHPSFGIACVSGVTPTPPQAESERERDRLETESNALHSRARPPIAPLHALYAFTIANQAQPTNTNARTHARAHTHTAIPIRVCLFWHEPFLQRKQQHKVANITHVARGAGSARQQPNAARSRSLHPPQTPRTTGHPRPTRHRAHAAGNLEP